MKKDNASAVVSISKQLKEKADRSSAYSQALLTQGILAVANHYDFPLNLSGSIETGILFKSDYKESGIHLFGEDLANQLNKVTTSMDNKESKGKVKPNQYWLVIQGRNIEELIHNVADEIER